MICQPLGFGLARFLQQVHRCLGVGAGRVTLAQFRVHNGQMPAQFGFVLSVAEMAGKGQRLFKQSDRLGVVAKLRTGETELRER